MSTTPIMDPLQQPPPTLVVNQQSYSDHPDHGSVGPVIGVLVAIAILGTIAIIIGRICSGRGFMGRGYYDFEGWVETKCGSCINGWVDPLPSPVAAESGGSSPVSEVVETSEEDAYSDHQSNTSSTSNLHEHVFT